MTPSIDQQGGKLWHFKPEHAAWLVAGLLMAAAQHGSAAVLGDIVGLSPIGQPLRVEISSPGSRGDEIAACIRALSPPSADGIPSVDNARVSLTGRDQNARIVVTHPDPAGEPILRLTLENTCTSRLRREYVLLLPEPIDLAPAPVAPATRTIRTATPPPAASSTRRGDTQTWVTVPGESLNSLAQAMYPKDPGARRAFTSGILSANPELFGSSADAALVLPAGTQLNVPSAARVATASSVSRAQPSRAQTRAPEAAAREQPGSAPATRAAAAPATPAPVVDRLFLEQAATGTGAADSDRVSPEAREIAREESLVAAVDRTIEMQLELLQRMRRLEEIQLALRAQLEAEETSTAAVARAPVAPEVSEAIPERAGEGVPEGAEAPTSATGTNTWFGWAILLGVVAFLLALLLKRKGSNAATAASDTLKRSAVGQGKATVQGAWPDAAPTGVFERAIQDDRERPGQGAAKAVPVAVEWGDLEQPTEPAVSEVPTLAPLTVDDAVEEHESAVELADIMVSFGRLQGAAETLADFIRSNPKQALTPWLKLMEVYRVADMKSEFDALARQLNKTFNVKTVTWANFDEARKHGGSIEAMPHILKTVTQTWRTRECQAYLESIVRDNREGTRQGFGLGVIDDILVLSAILDEQLGRYKPPVE